MSSLQQLQQRTDTVERSLICDWKKAGTVFSLQKLELLKNNYRTVIYLQKLHLRITKTVFSLQEQSTVKLERSLARNSYRKGS
jgi:hypothetical protein